MSAALLAFILLTASGDSMLPARPVISAETGGIKGVIHAQSGAPVAGVRIILRGRDGTTWVASTDLKGEFKAGSLPAGEYQVELSKEKQQTGVYTKVMIKANTWLLGAAERPQEQGTKRRSQLTWIGPVKYEKPVALISPIAPPKTEKIPMH